MGFVVPLLAVIVAEGLITYLKSFFARGRFRWQMLASLAIGAFAAAAYDAGLFVLAGAGCAISKPLLAQEPGCALTVVSSRGRAMSLT